MLPDSRKSLNCGRWSPCRVSGARLNWESTSSGTFSSFDSSFIPREIVLIS